MELKNRLSLIKWPLCISLLFIVGGVYLWCDRLDKTAQVNPEPSLFFTIKGRFPFNDGYRFKFYAKYSTENKDCYKNFYAFGIFRAASKPISMRVELPMERDIAGNHYVVQVYNDQVLSGFCSWTMNSIGYFLVKVGSALDREINNKPNNKRMEVGTYLSSKHYDWLQIKQSNIEIRCWPDHGYGTLDGSVRCERNDEKLISDMVSLYNNGKYIHIGMPAVININFDMVDGNNVEC